MNTLYCIEWCKDTTIRYIEQWTKTFCKKNGLPGRSETGRPAGQPAMILKFTGRVEKILTGSISDLGVGTPKPC